MRDVMRSSVTVTTNEKQKYTHHRDSQMKRVPTLCLIFLISIFLSPPCSSAADNEKVWIDDLFGFSNETFSFEFARALGYAYNHAADLGECIKTAKSIQDGNITAWFNSWRDVADLTASCVEGLLNSSQSQIDVSDIRMRASNYYRACEFYYRSPDLRGIALQYFSKSVKMFRLATQGMAQVLQIPYKDDKVLIGYFFECKNSHQGGKCPLLIAHSGFDGTAFELYFNLGPQALQHGYHLLVFDGPGQGETLRDQSLYFLNEWELPVTAVVDFALSEFKDVVDPDRIALFGISMGGYLAPRAVAFEKRIAVCVANTGIYDFGGSYWNKFPSPLISLLESNSTAFDIEMEYEMTKDVELAWLMQNGMFTFGLNTPSEFMFAVENYTLATVVDSIDSTYMIIVNSTGDRFVPGEADVLYSKLKNAVGKEIITFTEREAAQEHCQVGALALSNARIFNRLDAVLGRPSAESSTAKLVPSLLSVVLLFFL